MKQTPKRPTGPVAMVNRMDTPVKLLREIKERRIDPRSLNTDERRACVAVLANGKQSTHELAEIFGVSPPTIERDLAHLRREYGKLVRTWSPEDVLGMIAMHADRCTTLAFRQEDVGLAWTIKRDLVELLMKLGVGKDTAGQGEVQGLKVTIETVTSQHAAAKGLLGRAMNPLLTGEEIVVDATPSTSPKAKGSEGEFAAPQTPEGVPTLGKQHGPTAPRLPVRHKRASEPKSDPGISIEVRTQGDE